MRKGDEALVEDREPSHARVEHPYRPRVHRSDSTNAHGALPLPRALRRLILLVACASLAWPGLARAWAKQDVAIPTSDGVKLASTLYLPDGQPPTGGWPAIMLLHGLGGDREDMNTLAELAFLPGEEYAVLTFDARGHGETGGLFTLDGPREVADVSEAFAWLAARPDIADDRIGAWGISYGGGAIWNALAAGVPFAAAETCQTWTDLYSALFPQDLSKSGAVARLFTEVPTDALPTRDRAVPRLVPRLDEPPGAPGVLGRTLLALAPLVREHARVHDAGTP